MATVLLVGTPPEYRDRFAFTAKNSGHRCIPVDDLAQAYAYYAHTYCDMVVASESRVPEQGAWLTPFMDNGCAPHVVVVTAVYDRDRGRKLLEQGALHYLPLDRAAEALNVLLTQLREHRRPDPDRPLPSKFNIMGTSPSLLRAFDQAQRYAGSDASVLINGETGTGKELFAKALHKMSPRRNGPFITVDCASLPETLVESLLFGYYRGAFTGASSNKDGLIKLANRGTLFLDEVGELNPNIQKKFLRVLQERRFRPVGGGAECESDFRLIAATNRDLAQMVADGQFREDLYYRLHILHIKIPALAERGEDVPLIARSIADRLCEKKGVPPKNLSEDLAFCLRMYSWPGNVRELASTMESMFALAWDKPALLVEHLPRAMHDRLLAELECKVPAAGAADFPLHLLERRRNRGDRRHAGVDEMPPPSGGGAKSAAVPPPPSRKVRPEKFREARRQVLDCFEKEYLLRLYRESEADIHKACDISRLSRPRLYELYRKHKIQRCDFV